MKKNRLLEFFYGLKGSTKFLFFLTASFTLGLTSCSKEELNEPLVEGNINLEIAPASRAASSGTTIEEIIFSATALIEHCHGENIAFTGTIENRVSKTVDRKGVVHYSRSFRTKNMTGTGQKTNTEYDVLGGAEMFAIKNAVLNPNGTLNLSSSLTESDIVIHQGTLVFRSELDGSLVVARHVINKVPGQETTINEWRCGGKG